MDSWILRGIFCLTLVYSSAVIEPAGQNAGSAVNGALGLLFAVCAIVFEMRIRRLGLKTLIGAVAGSLLGMLGAVLISYILGQMDAIDHRSLTFLQLAVMLLMSYTGLMVGADKGSLLNLKALDGLFSADRTPAGTSKILDTSVIIDGRVADVFETGFLEGPFVIPFFVLNELQLVADSPDPVRRARGRRGLDILQRLQKIGGGSVIFVQTDYPDIHEVDLKLMELARDTNAKIMTNDFNLNKVAQLRGIGVLNINDLANALKPLVPPGETMKVLVLREGKEESQGVAYLDDGTMVVVEEGRGLIGKNVEIVVTSLLQTTAGKMIFGRVSRILGTAVNPEMRQAENQKKSI